MNRRSLLLFTTLMGAFAPLRLLAQDPARRASGARRVSSEDDIDQPIGRRGSTTKSRRSPDDESIRQVADEREPAADQDDVPPNLPTEPGRMWKKYDISKYTNLPHKDNNPQSSIVDWIFRGTPASLWHGEKIAVLSAGRAKLQAYHDAKTIDKVSEVVERFVDAQHDYLKLKIRFVATADTRWRYQVFKRLTLVGSGPQGQQIWSLANEDAAQVLTQMQIWQGFRQIALQQFEMINGQTLVMNTSSPRPFTGGMERDGTAGAGFQPKTEQLEEGVTLRLSPLLTYEGDSLDAAIELTANTVRSFHQTRVIAPREVGPGELKIDVPEVSETRLNQTVKDWPIGKTLLISAGIQPGILQSKTGLFRIPGTVPTSTELLVFIEVAVSDERPSRDEKPTRDEKPSRKVTARPRNRDLE